MKGIRDFSQDLFNYLLVVNFMDKDSRFMFEAIKEAEKSLDEGGIPIGAVLVSNDKIISKGHNRMVQEDSPILHAEMDAINNAGRLSSKEYESLTLYTTLSPCPMCSGAVVLYNIPRVVIGDNITLMGAESFLLDNNVDVKVLNLKEASDVFNKLLDKDPNLWKRELDRVENSTDVKKID